MKNQYLKLLGRILLLIVLLFIGSAIIRKAVGLPYGWVTERMLAGEQVLHRQGSNYNAIFLGSSRVYRGVVPRAFDKFVNNNSNLKMRSFNYGQGGSTSGQIYGAARSFIADKSLDLDYMFIELRSMETSLWEKAFVKNLHTHRARIWLLDFKALKFGISTMWGVNDEDWGFLKKLRYTGYFILKYVENKLNVGSMIKMWEAKNTKPKIRKELCEEGFCPMDFATNVDIKKLRKKFLKKADATLANNVQKSKVFGSGKPGYDFPDFNEAYADELIALIDEAKANGIKLIVMALPMMKAHDYNNVYSVFEVLPEENKIDIADSRSNPELYMFDHCWDDTHANQVGARLLSQRLGQRFIQLERDKKVKVPYYKNNQ